MNFMSFIEHMAYLYALIARLFMAKYISYEYMLSTSNIFQTPNLQSMSLNYDLFNIYYYSVLIVHIKLQTIIVLIYY